ncbi:MAG: DNA mismatch repair endonuclease MutL [Saprospiraceae bacterium]|nr:DNA mismatch repair endonuclease MutL [Candidatus Vicinibacter affinis]MBP6172717.1 DNA mismatch repair endonuclease MutL [Saprospiraceae bacterium]MBK7302142.1 DNA mismatch repair endonuclease MutL [Candidatus Vicinibacter affinis]MBK7798090.1 DNA mismatch repair endonuclease MutL [Candidatus Vicinibacter affinis]MBK8641300.1 DNA mismatch repair endonuclease MutL [Candidatus Vicinibacter affinis]
MSDLIRLLPDGVVNQIAAGEVIQRPASVVKELLDNAVDSGAGEIKLLVKEAGKLLIQVNDNGCGMGPTDARMSFERHATSKIKSAEDLFAIQTKGFRGEALASIASVAQVEMKTRRHEDSIGTRIQISDSKIRLQEGCACLPGTQISVEQLFFSIPARRKFLKSDTVELRHIHDEFISQALAHPEIKWVYTQGENEMYNLPAGSLKQRILNIYGKKYVEDLIALEQDTEVVQITGFIGKPELIKKTRGEQILFVNRRLIKSPYLNHAIISAYEELIAPGAYPFYVLFLQIDPAKIDINVHPTKHEIKFDDERLIYNFLKVTVKHALGKHSLAPRLDFENANPGLDQMMGNTGQFTPRPQTGGSATHWKNLAFPSVPRDVIQQREDQVFAPLNTDTSDEGFFPQQELLDIVPFQIYNSYIFYASRNGLTFIDQQAAHERIMYEYYKKSMSEQTQLSQRLLFPQTFHLSKTDAKILSSLQEYFNAIGFELEEFGSDSFVIHGMPALLQGKFSETELIHKVLEQYKFNLEFELSPIENIARSMALSSSIKKGKSLSQEEMSALIEQLFLCEKPNLSPTGKKCYFNIKHQDFLKNFNAL